MHLPRINRQIIEKPHVKKHYRGSRVEAVGPAHNLACWNHLWYFTTFVIKILLNFKSIVILLPGYWKITSLIETQQGPDSTVTSTCFAGGSVTTLLWQPFGAAGATSNNKFTWPHGSTGGSCGISSPRLQIRVERANQPEGTNQLRMKVPVWAPGSRSDLVTFKDFEVCTSVLPPRGNHIIWVSHVLVFFASTENVANIRLNMKSRTSFLWIHCRPAQLNLGLRLHMPYYWQITWWAHARGLILQSL